MNDKKPFEWNAREHKYKVWEAGGYQISRYLYNETTPNDILVWALEHLETYDIYTLYHIRERHFLGLAKQISARLRGK